MSAQPPNTASRAQPRTPADETTGWSHEHCRSRTHYWVVGEPTRDVYLRSSSVNFVDHRVDFDTERGRQAVHYAGDPIRWGEKRTAVSDLGQFAAFPGAILRNGGGVRNTATHLAKLCQEHQLSHAVTAVDSTREWPALAEEYRVRRVGHFSLGLNGAPVNLILANRGTIPQRTILKSPVACIPLTPQQSNRVYEILSAENGVLLVNSPKDRDLTNSAVLAARRTRAPQFSVLSPSLPVADRLGLLLANDAASVCNLSEFASLAQAMGITCPADETTCRLDDVAEALASVSDRHAAGDVVITLGSRGLLLRDSFTNLVAHVALKPHANLRIQPLIRARPEHVNGIGDRFFAAFVLAHVHFRGNPRTNSRAARAAVQASVDVVRDLGGAHPLEASSFSVRPFPVGFLSPRPGLRTPQKHQQSGGLTCERAAPEYIAA